MLLYRYNEYRFFIVHHCPQCSSLGEDDKLGIDYTDNHIQLASIKDNIINDKLRILICYKKCIQFKRRFHAKLLIKKLAVEKLHAEQISPNLSDRLVPIHL